jgi:hypothetical protein
MYATIRRYPTKAVTGGAIGDLKQRIEAGFLPLIQDVRGFHSYGVVNAAGKELVTVSIFEDKEGATESTRRAAEFVKKDPLRDQLGSPEIIEGEVLVLKDAAVGVR